MRFPALVFALAALIVSIEVARADDDAAPVPQATVSASVQTTTVALRDLERTVSAYGVLQAEPGARTTVATPRAGVVGAVLVAPGEHVEKGARLLTLITAPGAAAAYAQAKAQAEYAEEELARITRLRKQDLASAAELAAARQAQADAHSRLKAAEAVGGSASHQLVRAAGAGTVTQLAVQEGERLAADTALLQLVPDTGRAVILGVEPEDAAHIQAGMPVKLSPVFGGGAALDGKVVRVGAMLDPKTQRVDVWVSVAHASRVSLGSHFSGRIVLAKRRLPAVPHSAVLSDDEGSYVFRVVKGKAQRVAVTPVLESDGWVGIASGLSAGDTVVTLGNYELEDGMAVRDAGG